MGEEALELFDELWFKISPSQLADLLALRASPRALEQSLAYSFDSVGPDKSAGVGCGFVKVFESQKASPNELGQLFRPLAKTFQLPTTSLSVAR